MKTSPRLSSSICADERTGQARDAPGRPPIARQQDSRAGDRARPVSAGGGSIAAKTDVAALTQR